MYQSIDNQALKNVYSLSKIVGGKMKKMSVDELSANVKALIMQAYTRQTENVDEDCPIIVGKKISHGQMLAVNGEMVKVWWSGVIVSQVIIH